MTSIDEFATSDAPVTARGNTKLQRWMDLLAALLSRRNAATFEELAREIPEFHRKLMEAEQIDDQQKRTTLLESLKRAFERDKADLRAMGVLIESLEDDDGNAGGAYRLQRRNFYLPYLAAVGADGSTTKPQRPKRYGYGELATLAFEADELQAVVDAALTVQTLGDPTLEADASAALRKLAFDLPVGAMDVSGGDPRPVRTRAIVEAEVFAALSDALHRRKNVTFDYHNFGAGAHETRRVRPYGLFFLNGNWYLAAHDIDREALRNFRLSRISDVKVNTKQPGTPDFGIPHSFRLRDHATSRHAWELGEDAAVVVKVRFDGNSGATMAARRLGADVENEPDVRAFHVRRMDTFVRWMLSFGGEVVPVEPREAVEAYRSILLELRELYEQGAQDNVAVSDRRVRVNLSGAWKPAGAAAQFKRLLSLIPDISDDGEKPVEELAALAGVDVQTLLKDLYGLVRRFDAPGGFVDGIQMWVEQGTVSVVTSHLRRPMRLTHTELRALELGLAILRNHRTPDEHAIIESATTRIRALIAGTPPDEHPAHRHASYGTLPDGRFMQTVREALLSRRQLDITYRKSGAEEADKRTVCPYLLIAESGVFYVMSYCTREEGLRLFRLDRMEDARVTEREFEMPRMDELESALAPHRAFLQDEHQNMRVRYSARIAPWIAEREGYEHVEGEPLVVEHEVADLEWATRHVLQYGTDAQVVWPPQVVDYVRGRIEAAIRTVEQKQQ